MFIRKCYSILGRDIRILGVGDSGVEKTFFRYYLLYQIAQRNETAIYHGTYPFLQGRCFNHFCKRTYCINFSQKVWYITDDPEDDEKNISFRKLCCVLLRSEKRYIPVWIESCKDNIFILQ
jgi:hypothetical protein